MVITKIMNGEIKDENQYKLIFQQILLRNIPPQENSVQRLPAWAQDDCLDRKRRLLPHHQKLTDIPRDYVSNSRQQSQAPMLG
jgi:hypothetical protein